MTYAVNRVNTAVDAWQVVIDRVNTLANLASNAMVTVDGTANGSTTTGNAVVNGSFGAVTMVVYSTLRGGTLAAPGTLVFGSNATWGNTSSNTQVGNGYVSTQQLSVGAFSVNTTALALGQLTVNTTAAALGGSNLATVATRFSLGNTTSSVTRSRLNLVQGNNVTLTVTDEAANGQVTVRIDSIQSALSVGGSNTMVLFNDSGALGGTSGLSFNRTANNLSVGNTVYAQTLILDGAGFFDQLNTTTSGTAAQLVDTWSLSGYRQAKYTASVKNTSANGYAAAEMTLLQDGTDSHLLVYGSVSTNGALGAWSANVSGGSVNLWYTPQVGGTSIRLIRQLLTV